MARSAGPVASVPPRSRLRDHRSARPWFTQFLDVQDRVLQLLSDTEHRDSDRLHRAAGRHEVQHDRSTAPVATRHRRQGQAPTDAYGNPVNAECRITVGDQQRHGDARRRPRRVSTRTGDRWRSSPFGEAAISTLSLRRSARYALDATAGSLSASPARPSRSSPTWRKLQRGQLQEHGAFSVHRPADDLRDDHSRANRTASTTTWC